MVVHQLQSMLGYFFLRQGHRGDHATPAGRPGSAAATRGQAGGRFQPFIFSAPGRVEPPASGTRPASPDA